jgi:hypothetical protein
MPKDEGIAEEKSKNPLGKRQEQRLRDPRKK